MAGGGEISTGGVGCWCEGLCGIMFRVPRGGRTGCIRFWVHVVTLAV